MNGREIAYQILMDVYSKKTYSNLALNRAFRTHNVSVKDRSFITNLVYGVLQNDIALDYIISNVLTKETIRLKMRVLLKMALYQKRHLDRIPLYAIINESVSIVKKNESNSLSAFANAILHKLLETDFEIKRSNFSSDYEYYSTLYSCPLWILKLIAKQYGDQNAFQYAYYNQVEAPFALRLNTMLTTKEKLLQKDQLFKAGNLSPVGLFYQGNIPINHTNEHLNGLISVQDESGQLVALKLEPSEEDYILDMCAAPGSKTGHIAEMMNNKGKIVAVDLYEHRLKLLEHNLRRLHLTNVEIKQADAMELNKHYRSGTFDKILLDAPCSGFGVIRRKPDIALKIQPHNLDELEIIQKRMLIAASKLLKKGGTLVYSTCTLNKKENEMQVKYLLERDSSFKLVEERTIFPQEYMSDGFYIAKLIKE